MVRMGCLKPLFRLFCGCMMKKKTTIRQVSGATYTKVPTDEDFSFSPREDVEPAANLAPVLGVLNRSIMYRRFTNN